MRELVLFVIGGGSGGVRVALAESHRLGGTCMIRGRVPEKLMVLASRFAQSFDEASGFGWPAAARVSGRAMCSSRSAPSPTRARLT